VGVALFILMLAPVPSLRYPSAAVFRGDMRRLFLPLATLILLVAAILRLWQLSSYPPGPHYDEAVYLIITRSIALGGARFFPIVDAYQGREVLYMYLNAPLLHLLGDRIFTLHLSNAFFNLITVAASMALGRAMFRGRRGIIVALAVGVLIALSFPQIWLGRQAFRAVSQPLMQAFALVCLWRGLRGSWRWLALGGFFAGAVLYTYNASRLFPMWLALGGLALLLADRKQWRLRLRQGLLFFSVLVITALPMAIYAIQRPDIFFGRLEEVTQPGQSVTLAESVVLHLRMFFIEGDPYLRYNIPHRPYLTWTEGALMLLGMGVAAWRLFTGRRLDAPERAAYALALLSPLMVIPSLISVGGLPPSHMRSLGMIPLIFVLVAVGFEALFERIVSVARLSAPRTLAITVLGTVVIGGVLVGKVYFDWASRADLYYETDADLNSAAHWLIAQQENGALENTVVYVAAQDRNHPTMTIQPIPPVTWLGTDTLIRAPEGSEGLYIFPRSAPSPDDWREWLKAGQIDDLPLGPDGRTAFEAFRLPGDTSLPRSNGLTTENVRNAYMTLAGLQSPPIVAGGHGAAVMNWHIVAQIPVRDFTPILQLEGDQGMALFRVHQVLTGTDDWRVGEVVLDRVEVEVPIGTPPGDYPLRVAWVERSTNQYESYLNENGTQGGIWAEVGRLTVNRPPQFPDASALAIDQRHEVDVAPGVRLLGWDNPPHSLRPGETVSVTLFWQGMAVEGGRAAPELRAVLRNADGEETALWTGTPTGGEYPTEAWADGELVTDHLRWSVPREQPGGTYAIWLRAGSDEAELGLLEISGVARVYEPPPVQHLIDARFGDALRLLGYTLETIDGEVHLALVWQADEVVSADYKVFVHVLDVDGTIIDQRDAMPRNNTYPTSLWAAGEYVTDLYYLPLPQQSFALRVGLYLPDTGERLPAYSAGVHLPDDYLVIAP
jgi:4-amino-4-deoxy-L-arabinose transferase-like glycosyltransferase